MNAPLRESVVVTGMGAITPFGSGVPALSEALRAGRSAVQLWDIEPFDTKVAAAMLPNKELSEWLEEMEGPAQRYRKEAKNILRKSSRSAALSGLAGVEAWCDAGLGGNDLASGQNGVIVGGHNLGMGYAESLRSKFNRSPHHLPPSYAMHMLDTDHVGVLSSLLGIHDYGMTVGGASASGNMALIQGAHLIALGVLERCLIIGPMAELDAMAFQSFDAMGALGGRELGITAEESSRPFDKSRSGFVYGQASAAVVIERERTALERGVAIHGYVRGAGVCLDGTTLPSPSAEGEAKAMNKALKQGGACAGMIDLVNAHATSSVLGDEVELEAIAAVFGTHKKDILIQSTKEFTGHTLWAAGLLEFVSVLIQMGDDFIHPSINLKDPIRDDLRFVGSQAVSPGPSLVLNNSFGFAGINTSVLVSKDAKEISHG